ncbi:MAG: glutamate-1-semialdehyde-2,1-aminomutase [Acidobacteria bacterium]|nr:MAG: glutamate-1-semialdehyde-2,1-aminomutase [Acidobacteriota bacterium]
MPRKLDECRRLQKRAEQLIPGGVSSPVRAFKAVECDAPFIVRGQGSHIWDADGNEYIDYVGSWGPLILGHAEPNVVEAILSAAVNGTSFGASTPAEADLAELVIEAFPTLQKVRFVSSGTEATMSAIRLARAYTKRKYVIKFEGCYHGHADSLLVKAGSGVATLGIPGSAGVLEEVSQFTIALPFNDTEVLEQAFSKYRHMIACVIVEPVVGNMGCVPAEGDYLANLRTITQREKTVLIFDEVMTGFRVAYGGAQELYGIKPDLTTLGKIIGGGLPVGAYGGRSEIMDLVAPLGPMYQAGTLSGNPIAVTAGRATLGVLKNSSIYNDLEERSAEFAAGVRAAAEKHNVSIAFNRVGSMWTLFFTDAPVVDFESANRSNREKFARFFHLMLGEGVYLPPSQMEAAFFSAAHAKKDILQLIERVDRVLKKIAWEFEKSARGKKRRLPTRSADSGVLDRCTALEHYFAFCWFF